MTQREKQILQMIEADPMISQQAIAQTLGITRSSVAVHISNLMKKGAIAGKGYVLRRSSYAVVVGGVNVDIGGRSFAPLVAADSNPGRVNISLGGVGRNIAHNMCLLGMSVHLLTAYGDDANGRRISASCGGLGIDIHHALCLPHQNTSTYLYLTDPDGEMVLAVSDMEICKRITPQYLASKLSLLQGAQLVVADANIPEESLVFLAENCGAPLFVDPVSTAKARKLANILPGIHTLKPNELEASLLTGIPLSEEAHVEKAADRLLEMGVQRVFITMGSGGVYAAEGDRRIWLPNLPGKMVNTTGCGDSFMGALAWAYTQGADLRTSALAGLAAGAVTMESLETINPVLSAQTVKERMEQNTK